MNEEERKAVSEFVGGNIQFFKESWESFTNDVRVLDFVYVVKIDFIELPTQIFVPKEISFSVQEDESIDSEIDKFVKKGIIEKVVHCNGEYIFHIFTRPKPNG